MTVTVIDSNEEWLKLAPLWNTLLDGSVSCSVFLTWEWLSAWSECCLGINRSLFIINFHENGHLVGVAPFYIERKSFGPFSMREIRFLGSPEAGSDYLDVFAQKGRERDVANALYDFLTESAASAWDQLVLSDIPSNSLFLLHFLKRVQFEGKYAEIDYCSYCPVTNLQVTEREFPSEISPTRRKKFKQELGILHRDTGVEHIIDSGENLNRIEDFFCLYEEKGGWSGKVLRPILRNYIGRYKGDCPVQIDMLKIKGQSVAGLLHLQYRKTLSLYLMAVDKTFNPKISIGNILVGLCIKNAVAAGLSTYDFLKGEESYKFHWASGGRSTMQLIFCQKHPVALACSLARLARYAGKLLMR